MGRLRVLLAVFLVALASYTVATDYRLVVASDDPAVRKAPTLVIFEGTGKLLPSDRITSITFSGGAEVKPNCLVSLDPAAGKTPIPLGPEIQVFKGTAMLAGVKPTKKVIPGYLMVDTPVSAQDQTKTQSMMTPIIQKVNNLPWLYIVLGVGVVMGFMFLMNRKSQVFTTNMTQEAKNLYVETVNRITDRLERIEASQEQLVKNPPVLRAFRVQIAEFEGRLARIEKLAIESKDELGRATKEIAATEVRFSSLAGFMESAKNEAVQTQSAVKRESESIRVEVRALSTALDEAKKRLLKLDEVAGATQALGDQSKQTDAKVTTLGTAQAAAATESTKQVQELRAEIEALKVGIAELAGLRQEIQQITSDLSKLPSEIQSIRSAIPTMDLVESKLSEIKAFGAKFDQLDEISTKLDHLPEIKGSLDALPSHFPKLDENLVKSGDFEKLAAQLDALNEIKVSLANLPSQLPKLDDGLAKSKDLEKLFSQLAEIGEIKSKLDALPSQLPKLDDGLAKSQDLEKLFAQLAEIGEIKSKLDALPSQMPKLDEGLAKSHDLERLSVQLAELGEIKNKLDALPSQMPDIGENLADFQDSVKRQIEGLNGKIDESGANLVELITASNGEATEDEDRGTDTKRRGKKSKSSKEEAAASEGDDSKPTAPIATNPSTGEFSFNNAIRQMGESALEAKKKEEQEAVAAVETPTNFSLGELPDRLETFEDSGPEAVLPTFRADQTDDDGPADKHAVELLLQELTAINKPSQADDDIDLIDDEPIDLDDTDGVRWSGLGGSSARTWSSSSTRPLDIVAFEGELKPVTPIETAPSGEPIGAVAYGFGRVLYSCGQKVHGFWPGREGRSLAMDHAIPTDDWRLATTGQNLFVAEPKKVKIVSLQGWFVLEQFSGEYHDQLVTKAHWVGTRNDRGAVMDIRNHRGQVVGENIDLGTGLDGLKLCGHGNRIFAGTSEGVVSEVTELGTEKLAAGPDGSRVVHLTFADAAPLAILRIDNQLEAWHLGEDIRKVPLGIAAYSGVPVVLGNWIYFADVENHQLVGLDVRKSKVTRIPAFEGVSSIRRNIGIYHKGQHTMFAVTVDEGKRGGRLISIDARNGWETTFSLVGQANVNLISADHHLVISTSNQYQNLVRVLEPFQLRAAA